MSFDLSSVLNQAQEVTNNSQDNGGSGRPRIIYPGLGTLKVKLLYNPASNLVSRIVNRHKVGDSNYVCLKMYGGECPICKTIDNIKNSTGADLWKYNPKSRGISYAQYVGSQNYEWDNDYKEPAVGTLFLLMYPWTVYQDINRIISSAGAYAEELIAKNEGKILNITHYIDNGQHRYKVEVDAFAQPFKSCSNDEEFEQFMKDLPNLNDSVVPAIMNNDIFKATSDAAEALSREYLHGVSNAMSGGFSNQSLSGSQIMTIDGKQYANVNGQLIPIASNTTENRATNITNTVQTSPNDFINVPEGVTEELPFEPDKTTNQSNTGPTTADGQQLPECFGKHQDNDPKCLSCMHEINCMVTSSN